MKAFVNLPEKDKRFLHMDRRKSHSVLVLKCFQFLEMFSAGFKDIFLTGPNQSNLQNKKEFLHLREGLGAVCSSERYCESAVWFHLSDVFLPKRRDHVELVCYLLCESLAVALPHKVITMLSHDIFTGHVRMFEDETDNLEACFRNVFEKCEYDAIDLLLQLLGFVQRIQIAENGTDISNEIGKRESSLHFCCMAAPYVMEVPDPNMLLVLSKDGLVYFFSLGFKLNQPALLDESPTDDNNNLTTSDSESRLVHIRSRHNIWNIIPVLVTQITKCIEKLETTAFFAHNSPVDLFQSTSVWRTSNDSINIRASEVSQLCAQIINKCLQSESFTEFKDGIVDIFDEACEENEKRCLLGASSIPNILFNIFEEPLIPPFMYDEFVTAGACFNDQAQLNDALSRLVATIPLNRRQALERLCFLLEHILRMERKYANNFESSFW